MTPPKTSQLSLNLLQVKIYLILYYSKIILHNHSHVIIYLATNYCPIMPHTHEVITPAISLKNNMGPNSQAELCSQAIAGTSEWACRIWKRKMNQWHCFKVLIVWEAHKMLRNLHRRFDWHYIGQIYGGDFAKFYGLLRIYELYLINFFFWHSINHLFRLHNDSRSEFYKVIK